MRRRIGAGLAAGAMALTAAAAEPPPGRKLYTSYCARCHGLDLQLTSSAFYDLRSFPADDKPRFLRSVNQGLRAMPAWQGIVKPEEIELIWDYIGVVNGWERKAASAPPR